MLSDAGLPHPEGIPAALETVLWPLIAVALAMARPLGLALVVPVFTRINLGLLVSAGYAFSLALPQVRPVLAQLAGLGQAAPGFARLGLLGSKEMAAGVLLGMLFGLPLWGLQSAGELLDTQRSAPSAGASDPGAGGQMAASASLIGTAAVVLFVAAGGLRTIATTLYASYGVWPMLRLSPELAQTAPAAALALLDDVSATALLAAAPVMLAMLLADAAVMLIGRAVPKLGVFDLGATLRNLVFVAGMGLYAVFLVQYMGGQVALLGGAGAQFSRLVH